MEAFTVFVGMQLSLHVYTTCTHAWTEYFISTDSHCSNKCRSVNRDTGRVIFYIRAVSKSIAMATFINIVVLLIIMNVFLCCQCRINWQ